MKTYKEAYDLLSVRIELGGFESITFDMYPMEAMKLLNVLPDRLKMIRVSDNTYTVKYIKPKRLITYDIFVWFVIINTIITILLLILNYGKEFIC